MGRGWRISVMAVDQLMVLTVLRRYIRGSELFRQNEPRFVALPGNPMTAGEPHDGRAVPAAHRRPGAVACLPGKPHARGETPCKLGLAADALVAGQWRCA